MNTRLPHRRAPAPTRSLTATSLWALACAAIVCAAPRAATAQTFWWAGPTDALWSSTTSWSTGSAAATPNPSAVPGSANTAVFNISTLTTPQTVYLNGNQSALGLSFVSSGSTTITGGTAGAPAANALTIGTGGVTLSSGAGPVTISTTGTVTNSGTYSLAAGTQLSITSRLATNLWLVGGGTMTYSGGLNTVSNRIFVGGGGTLIQNGGSAGTSDYMMVGRNNGANGPNLSGTGSYILQSGTLTVAQGIYLGWNPGSSGTFTQNGGFVETQTNGQGLQIGVGDAAGSPGTGAYVLNSGTLLSTFGSANAHAGSFTFGGGTFRARATTTAPNSTNVTTAIASGATAVIDTNTFTVTWSGAISGASAAGLTKLGSGTLALTNANTYTGTTTISAGVIQLSGGANRLATTGVVALAGGTLSLSGVAQTVANVVAGTGGGGITGSGTLTNNGSYTLAAAGPLTVSSPLAGNLRAVGSGTMTFTGGLATSARLIVGGSATVVQNGGAATVSGGEFMMVGGNGLATPSVSGPGAYVMQSGTLTVAQGIYIGWTTGRSGTFTQNGGFVETQTNGQGLQIGIEGGTGAYILNSGTLFSTFATDVTHGGSFTFGGGTLRARAAFTMNQPNVATSIASGSTGRIDTNGFDVTWTNALSGASASGLVKDGAGTLTLSNSNSYAGGTTLNLGTITVSNTFALGSTSGPLTVNAGTVNLNGRSISIGALSGSSGGLVTTANSTGTATLSTAVSSGTSVYAGTLANNGSGVVALTKSGAGTLSLTGTNSYTGPTTISGGTLQVGGSGQLGSGSYAGAITNNGVLSFTTSAGQTLSGAITNNGVLSFASSANHAISGGIGGSGSLGKTGSGRLTLTGSNTYAGATTVSGGSLVVNGAITASAMTVSGGAVLMGSGSTAGVTLTGGVVSPGNSPGTLTVGNLAWDATSSYLWEMYDYQAGAGTGWDLLSGTGALSVTGTGFTFNLVSLSGTATPGPAFNWSATKSGTFRIASFTGGISAPEGQWWTLNTGSFSPFSTTTGSFSLTVGGNDIDLVYTALVQPWNWTAGTGSWSTGSNWDLNTPPEGNVALIFSGSGGTATNDITTGTAAGQLGTISGITFSGSASGPYTLTGNGLTLGAAGIVNQSTSTQTVENQLTLAAPTFVDARTGNLVVSGSILTSGSLLTVTGTANTTLSGVVTGSGGLAKTGAGTLTLTGANDYTGGTTIASGSLVVGSGGVLPGNVTNNAALAFNRSDEATVAGVISGTGSLRQAGTGSLTLTGSNTFTGPTTIASGTLALGGAGVLGNGSYAGAISNAGVFSVATSAAQTLSGTISGTGSLVKSGAGTLTLSGSNSFSGGTTISGGTLAVSGGPNRLPTSGTVTLAGGTLALSGVAQSVAGVVAGPGGGGIVGSGTLTNTGIFMLGASPITATAALGNLWAMGSGTMTFSGGLATGNRLFVGGDGTLVQNGGSATVSSNWVMVGGNNGTGGPTSSGTGTYLMQSGTLTVSNGIYVGWRYDATANTSSGTFTQTGGQVETQDNGQGIMLGISNAGPAAGNGTYNLNGGTLISTFGSAAVPFAGSFNFGGGTFRARASFSTGAQAAVTTSIASGATAFIDTNGQTVTWNTPLTGASANGLTQSGGGTLILSGSNTYAGPTQATGGTIRAGDAAAFSSGTVSATGVTTNSGAVDLNGYSFANDFVIGSRSAGPGGAGALQNTNTGTTSVLDGNVSIGGENYVGGNGSITFNGVVSGGVNTIYSFFKQGTGTWRFANTANTFDGFYYQIAGTTEVTKLANINEASSLGRPTTAAMNEVRFGINGSGGGTIRFTGTDASASDRVFILQGATDAASNRIDASGVNATATLRLTGLLAGGRSGAYTAALGGTNAGVNVYEGIIANVLATTLSLLKDGSTTWSLEGTNTFTGSLTISAGTLALGGSGVLGGGSYAGAIVNNAAFDVATSANQTLSGVVSGSGTFTKSGAGTLTLSNASNSFSRGVALSGGTLAFASGGLGSGTVSMGADTALQWASGNTQDVSARLVLPASGDATLDVGANNVTLATGLGAGSAAGITKAGSGRLTLTGSSGYTGATTVTGGTLALSGSGDIAASSGVNLSASGATLDISAVGGNRTIGVLSGAAGSAILLGGNTLTADGGGPETPFGGVISGSGGFTKAGEGILKLTDLQTFTGPARIESGILALGGTTTLASARSIFVAADAILEAAPAGLTVVGGQTLGGSGEVIEGAVRFLAGSILSPGGSVGQLDGVVGATLTGGMTYVFEINDALGTAGGGLGGAGWDLFTSNGVITLDASGGNPIFLDVNTLAGTVSGSAANFNTNANYAWKFLVAGTSNSITFNPAMFSLDTSGFQNATNGSFYVARGDELTEGFGSGSNNELYLVYAAVPEPGTLALAGIGLATAAWAARRRRRAR